MQLYNIECCSTIYSVYVDNNEVKTIIDQDSSLQPGDAETKAFLVNGKHFIILNSGDVCSVVTIRKED